LRTSDFDPISVEIFNKQLKKTSLFVLAVFALIIFRLWFLQVVTGSTYRTKSENNRIHLQELSPFRGMILDRNSEMLVDNRPSYDLYVVPEEVQDQARLLKSLTRLVGIKPEQAEQKLDEGSLRYPFRPVCLQNDISRDELAVIETHRFNLPGVMIKVKPERHYVYGSLASHLLGYLGEINEAELRSGQYPDNKPGDLIGKSGVELKWQGFLNGTPGGEQVEVDAAGRRIRVVSQKAPIPGANICLTIDRQIQAVAEKALLDKQGAIIAIDPNNGEILAMASSPSFDPNQFIGGIDKVTWERISSSKEFPLQNRALAGQYPPGSVFKIVVSLAGLAEGVIDPEEEIVCNGVYFLGRNTYGCWKAHGPGINFHRAVVESCDVYFYEMGRRLGVDKIASYARRLGLGKITGFDVNQEKEGLIPTSDWKSERLGVPWQAGETLAMSIGQSFVLVTPIQMAVMVSAVFNGGVLYKPAVARWAGRTEGKKAYESVPRITGRLGIKEQYLELVKNALIGVVNEPHGTGSRAKLGNITVAGKTGTAQVVTLKKGKELDDGNGLPWRFRDHAWFVAVAPAERPEIALAVVIEHGGQGGAVAAPIAKEIIQAYLGQG
jgi:penicillin-binding protein 2